MQKNDYPIEINADNISFELPQSWIYVINSYGLHPICHRIAKTWKEEQYLDDVELGAKEPVSEPNTESVVTFDRESSTASLTTTQTALPIDRIVKRANAWMTIRPMR